MLALSAGQLLNILTLLGLSHSSGSLFQVLATFTMDGAFYGGFIAAQTGAVKIT